MGFAFDQSGQPNMKLVITISTILYLIALCQAMDKSKADDMKKVAKKAFEIYKEIDELKDEEENKLLEAFEKSPLNHYIDSQPEVNPNGSDKDEVENSEGTKTLMKIAWKVANKMMKKAINAIT
ncbi:uncharacterized protein LOC129576865 [Sitodiplosis mosellana]|uniref:uncharacterized protein LOC129576865 n=1 Tax=Sitodiplosis mosellana TaxID=263140 RepID=UPI0024449A30|nr:uncharacterized protein LOC129576865 [Sitodiplosis mosellana]